MTIQINFKENNQIPSNIDTVAIFFNSELRNNNFNKIFNQNDSKFILKILNNSEPQKKINIYNFDASRKLLMLDINKLSKFTDIENFGAEFYNFIKEHNIKNLSICSKSLSLTNQKNFIDHFLHGFKLKSYEFNLYKSKYKNRHIEINILGKDYFNIKNHIKFKAIETGTNFARDLVSEPPNILFPKEYVNRLLKLKKLGIKVAVYNEAKLNKLGMHSLLGVGKGSSKESYLVTLEWYGNKKNKKSPLSFVGKGVCFDTGGISLKPAKFMEEMKYDMAGSAVVAGLIQSLALRKAKVNAVGVVGLVENMPGGNAQRPGDIVKAFNGKTIEVLNTDAEGRLVLADALSFTEKKFKPKFIIDLATLTGAIIISLGEEYAGLFSNNDELSKKLIDAGEKVNEKVWRLPLHKNYDKLMDSTIADMQNINYSGGAGSITAAQFLQRFIEKTPWAHLDIAGMAFSKKAANLNPGGATGFGVRLLNQLIEEHYE